MSKRFYDKNKDKYVEEEQVRARHILIKVPQEVSPADEAKLKGKADDASETGEEGGRLRSAGQRVV